MTRKFVYAMRAGLFIKVGVSNDPGQRRLVLQREVGEPIRILRVWGPFDKPYSYENALHKALEEHRVFGEWFCLSDSILNDFTRIIDGHHPDDSPGRRIHVILGDEMEREFDRFKEDDHRPTDADAVRALMLRGLDQWRSEKPQTTPGQPPAQAQG